MKYIVRIENRTFDVEIENINARPVVALVDGKRFEIMPDNGMPATGSLSVAPALVTHPKQGPAPAASPISSSNILTAPLPGTVTEIFIAAGEQIEPGHVVMIIEAMKMKNSIRAIRGGVVKRVAVQAGQSVAHKQALVEFE